MSGPKPALLFGFLVFLVAVLGGVALMKGGLYIAKHEGDTLHLLQIVFRMADGEWPHLDFMTPIGIMAFLPIVGFVKSGMSIGHAILWAQVAVGLALVLPTFWVAYTRFNSALAYLFGLVVMVLALALVHGQTDRLVSISMHYNRWSWAVSYLVIVAAVLPAKAMGNDRVDGAIIGLGLSFLALCKVTYFISFAPAVLVALIARRAWPTLVAALLCGVAVIIAVTVSGGVGFWQAYLGDLMTVSGSDVRPQPGESLKSVIGAPDALGASLLCFLSVVLLRQAGQSVLGLALLLLVPGFFYVTFQNFGNDPQWLPLLAILLLAAPADPEARNASGWPLGRALVLAAVAALAFGTPSFLNLAYSPFRHATVDTSSYQPLLPSLEGQGDLQVRSVRANRIDARVAMDEPGSGLEYLQKLSDRDLTETVFMGERLPQCELQLGLVAWFESIMADLDASGLVHGKRIFAADLFNSHWLYGDVVRLEGGAPWYYGGLPGIESADFLLVPLCPSALDVRKIILETVEKRGIAVSEAFRGKLFILYKISRDTA